MSTPVTWSYTLPHSSPNIQYTNFLFDCTPDGNITRCGDGTSHTIVTDASDGQILVHFRGSAIELYGEVTGGAMYNTTYSFYEKTGYQNYTYEQGVPQGNLLAKKSGFYSHLVNTSTTSYSYSYLNDNTVTLKANRSSRTDTIKFTHAVITVDTWANAGQPTLKTYEFNDPSVTLSRGWIPNGTYWQSGDYDEATFNFVGNGVFVYGFCDTSAYSGFGGTVTLDGLSVGYRNMSSKQSPSAVTDDCLLVHQTELENKNHTLKWSAGGLYETTLLKNFQVLTFPPPAPGAVDAAVSTKVFGTSAGKTSFLAAAATLLLGVVSIC